MGSGEGDDDEDGIKYETIPFPVGRATGVAAAVVAVGNTKSDRALSSGGRTICRNDAARCDSLVLATGSFGVDQRR